MGSREKLDQDKAQLTERLELGVQICRERTQKRKSEGRYSDRSRKTLEGRNKEQNSKRRLDGEEVRH